MPHNWTAISGRIYEYQCQNCGHKIDNHRGFPSPDYKIFGRDRETGALIALGCEENIIWKTHAS
jgi:hypothetical protein